MNASVSICTDKSKWDRFVSTSQQECIFYHTAFLDALDVEYALVTACQGEEVLAGAIVLHRDGAGIASPTPFLQYCGVVLGREVTARGIHSHVQQGLLLVEMLLHDIVSRFGKVCFNLDPAFPDARAIQWYNYGEPQKGMFSISLRYTGLITLPAPEEFEAYISGIRSVRRQEYRRAQREGFRVEQSDDVELLDRLHAMTFNRQNVERSAREVDLLRRIAAAALGSGFGSMRVVRAPDGSPAAATLFVHDSRSSFYLIGANAPEYRKNGASTMLFLEHARGYAENGIRTLDVVGMNSPQRGDYKSSFNARPVPYFHAVFTGSE